MTGHEALDFKLKIDIVDNKYVFDITVQNLINGNSHCRSNFIDSNKKITIKKYSIGELISNGSEIKNKHVLKLILIIDSVESTIAEIDFTNLVSTKSTATKECLSNFGIENCTNLCLNFSYLENKRIFSNSIHGPFDINVGFNYHGK